jgi:hypothetical protein
MAVAFGSTQEAAMQRLSVLSAAIAAAIVPLVGSGTSVAQRDNIEFESVCFCYCEIDSSENLPDTGDPTNTYPVPLGGCSALDGRTCNREVVGPGDVVTIRSGKLAACIDDAQAVGARAEEFAPVEPQSMTPSPLFNKQLILQTPAAEPGKKPIKLKPVPQFDGFSTVPD